MSNPFQSLLHARLTLGGSSGRGKGARPDEIRLNQAAITTTGRSSVIRRLVIVGVLSLGFTRAEEPPGADQPGSSRSLLAESTQRLADGDYEGAIRDASLALQLDPKNPAAYEARGSIYIQEKLWDRAERDYTSAAKLSPDAVYKFKLAEIKLLQKAYEDAQPRFKALEGDATLGDFATYKAFLCDLLGAHEGAALHDLADRDRAASAPSVYFCHAAWDLYHGRRSDASKCFAAADQVYGHAVTETYFSGLVECQRFQLTTTTFSDRNGVTYSNAHVFLENSGLRVSTPQGWVTLAIDQLPDDLGAFPEELREQIDRRRAMQATLPPPTSLLSFTSLSGQRYEAVHWAPADTGISVLTANGWISVPVAELPSDLTPFPPDLQKTIEEKRRAHLPGRTARSTISFTTRQGKSYRDVKAVVGGAEIRVLTPDGWVAVPFGDLPDDLSSIPVEWREGIRTRRAGREARSGEMQVVSFTTKGGVRYDQVRAAVEAGGMRVVTPNGLVVVPFNQLPTDLSSFPLAWRETLAQKEAQSAQSAQASP